MLTYIMMPTNDAKDHSIFHCLYIVMSTIRVLFGSRKRCSLLAVSYLK